MPEGLFYREMRNMMMKTITDVVSCTMMTQYYTDEQIFVLLILTQLLSDIVVVVWDHEKF